MKLVYVIMTIKHVFSRTRNIVNFIFLRAYLTEKSLYQPYNKKDGSMHFTRMHCDRKINALKSEWILLIERQG